MWMRAFTQDRARARVQSREIRTQLGSLVCAMYDRVAELPAEQQDACLKIAQRAVDEFAQELLALLANIGDDLRVGAAHSARLRLDFEVYDVVTGRLVVSECINRGRSHLPDLWWKWINRLAPTGSAGVQSDP
jgi:GTP-sensing pleiotropic transcriptional regulator CodY